MNAHASDQQAQYRHDSFVTCSTLCLNAVVEVEDIEEEQYPPGHSGPKLSDAATAASSKETAEAAPALQGEEA